MLKCIVCYYIETLFYFLIRFCQRNLSTISVAEKSSKCQEIWKIESCDHPEVKFFVNINFSPNNGISTNCYIWTWSFKNYLQRDTNGSNPSKFAGHRTQKTVISSSNYYENVALPPSFKEALYQSKISTENCVRCNRNSIFCNFKILRCFADHPS